MAAVSSIRKSANTVRMRKEWTKLLEVGTFAIYCTTLPLSSSSFPTVH